MPEASVAFGGSVPVNYDRYMGPIFFHHYADDLAERLVVADGMRVLETACGTGIPPDVSSIAWADAAVWSRPISARR
jgi:hypothetical protein